MLRLEHISVAYGKHEALHDVSLEIEAGRTTVILGANGAGKTTLLKTIAGLQRPHPGGRILFQGRPIEGHAPHAIVAAGIALVPEGRRLFGEMTVIDNLRLGAYTEHARANEGIQLERMLALFPILAERRDQLAKTMSGGEQQMLAIARALMSEPKILLLDEPSLGLSPKLVRELFSTLATITKGGQSVVLVEQNVHQSLRLADRVYVLENGRVHSAGSPRDIQEDKVIQQAYLGLEERLAEPAPLPEPRYHAGGFRNPMARSVDALPALPAAPSVQPGRETAPTSAEGGFYNPYARTVPGAVPNHAPRSKKEEAPKSEPAKPQTPPSVPREGGFFNPYSRSKD
jgi:branched-chain amino acid transport system ATP-binding protein